MTAPIRVLVADDSSTAVRALKAAFAQHPRLQVVGTAADGVEAVALAKSLRPDVITMDVRMPRLDGLQAIAAIMAEAPSRILVVASVDEGQDLSLSFRAMSAGALEVIAKPQGGDGPEDLLRWGRGLADSVCLMAEVPVVTRRRTRARARPPWRGAGRVDAFGLVASTGGPPALAEVLGALPADLPIPIFVAQHITPGFARGLARWLSEMTALRVVLVQSPVAASPGTVYLAGDGSDLVIDHEGVVYAAAAEGPHGPSGDRLLTSLAHTYRERAGAAVLTGMGEDGARGLLAIRNGGGATFGQDSESSLVFGMPQAADRLGAAEAMLPLPAIAGAILELARPIPERGPG